ncbi:MAG: prepilin-type N-terminal cleavage/methylation domain-containing protein [Desulfobulbaceae bacterium]|nr:prepilin-type N-terminal cleavage/methylation domain-containing protein [Desulfobulbaceae bacterium]
MRLNRDQGFTIMELLVALTIASIVLAAISVTFTRTVRLYTLENAKAALQQEMRAALEIMGRDIRMAGYDPNRTGDFKIKTATATRFHFTTDLDENGVVDPAPAYPACEVLSYRLSAANNAVQVICGEGTGSQDPETMIGGLDSPVNVTALDFDYRKSDGQPTSSLTLIRAVVITITAEVPAGIAGMESRTYSTWVDLRNAGPNSSI